MRKKWTRETVFEESKKYSSRSGFKKNSSGAFSVAYENGWLPEMPWLKTPIRNKPTKWTREAVFEESKKYSTITDFNAKNATAYAIAKRNGWLDEMPWLERKYVIRGFWQSEVNVFNESHKYTTLKGFREGCSTAYYIAQSKGLLKKMTWLKRTDSKPSGYWNIKENVFQEAKKYTSIIDFYKGCNIAYYSAKNNGWLDDMDWLTKTERKDHGYWNIKNNVFAEAEKYEYKSDFRRNAPGAYDSARRHHWLGELKFKPKESKGDPRGPIQIIYVYEDNINKYAYVGATNDIKVRDEQHRKRINDSVYKYFKAKGMDIPECKVLLDGLTVKERQREERIQSLYYRDVLHYTLINKINLTGENVGSLGSLIKKWTKKAVLIEAQKYKTPTEFFTKSAGAYDAALRFKMMNKETFPWFYSKRMPPRWWNDKEHVFEESKKYKTWDEFFWKSSAAHNSARKHKWESEMTWLVRKQVPQKYWQNEEHVIEESKKYSKKSDFSKGSHAAYDYAKEHNLWAKMPWIKTKEREHGYWTKERVFEEAAKYKTKLEFRKSAYAAYQKATKNKWIGEMTWFISNSKPQGFWQDKKNVIEEARKYSSRSEFRWGTPSAYRSAVDNGWIDEMTWFKRPQKRNLKWTRDNVFLESHKYESRSAFKNGCSAAYKVANKNRWLDEMDWLKKRNK